MKGAVRQLSLRRARLPAREGRAKRLFNKMKRTAGIVLLTTALSLSVFATKPVMAEPPRKEAAELVAPQSAPEINLTEKIKTIEDTGNKTTKIEVVKPVTSQPTEEIKKAVVDSEKTEFVSNDKKITIRPYVMWRAPIRGNLFYAKSIRYRKYVRERKLPKIREWLRHQIQPIAFEASRVIASHIPSHKRFFPASSVIPKKLNHI